MPPVALQQCDPFVTSHRQGSTNRHGTSKWRVLGIVVMLRDVNSGQMCSKTLFHRFSTLYLVYLRKLGFMVHRLLAQEFPSSEATFLWLSNRSQTHDIEYAQIEIQVVEGLKVGNESLKKLHQVSNSALPTFHVKWLSCRTHCFASLMYAITGRESRSRKCQPGVGN